MYGDLDEARSIMHGDLFFTDEEIDAFFFIADQPLLIPRVGVDEFLTDVWSHGRGAHMKPTILGVESSEAKDKVFEGGYYLFFPSREAAEDFLHGSSTTIPSRSYPWLPPEHKRFAPRSGWLGGKISLNPEADLHSDATRFGSKVFAVRVKKKPGAKVEDLDGIERVQSSWDREVMGTGEERLLETKLFEDLTDYHYAQVGDPEETFLRVEDDIRGLISGEVSYQDLVLTRDLSWETIYEMVEVNESFKGLLQIGRNPSRVATLSGVDAYTDPRGRLTVVNRSAFVADPEIREYGEDLLSAINKDLPNPGEVAQGKLIKDLSLSFESGGNQAILFEHKGKAYFAKTTREHLANPGESSLASREALASMIADELGIGDMVPRTRTTVFGRAPGVVQEALEDLHSAKSVGGP